MDRTLAKIQYYIPRINRVQFKFFDMERCLVWRIHFKREMPYKFLNRPRCCSDSLLLLWSVLPQPQFHRRAWERSPKLNIATADLCMVCCMRESNSSPRRRWIKHGTVINLLKDKSFFIRRDNSLSMIHSTVIMFPVMSTRRLRLINRSTRVDVSCVVSHSKLSAELCASEEFFLDLYCIEMSFEPMSKVDIALPRGKALMPFFILLHLNVLRMVFKVIHPLCKTFSDHRFYLCIFFKFSL